MSQANYRAFLHWQVSCRAQVSFNSYVFKLIHHRPRDQKLTLAQVISGPIEQLSIVNHLEQSSQRGSKKQFYKGFSPKKWS